MIGSVYHSFVFVNKYFGEEGVSTTRGKREEGGVDGECCSKYHQKSHVAITRSDVEHLLIVTKCLLKYAQELLVEKID